MTTRLERRFMFAAALLAALGASRAGDAPKPKDLGLVEHAVSRLAQIDATVSGPQAAIEALTAADFEVRVNTKLVEGFTLDRVCREPETLAEGPGRAATAPEPPPVATPGRAPTYVFYFDHPHLTMAGRQNAIDMAREMLPKLVTGGAQATILSNAAEMTTIVPMTTSLPRLLDGLAAMEADGKQWDPYSALEEQRLAEVARAAAEDTRAGVALARRYQADERWRQDRDLRRLSWVLDRLAALEPPKAVLYFADTMRQNAGEHYLSFFGTNVLEQNDGLSSAMRMDSATALLPFDRVVNEASALGIRFYAVEGQGLQAQPSLAGSRSPATLSNAATTTLNTQRIRDAQGTLQSLAAETGGEAFINGVATAKVTAKILADLSCVVLISFDPRGFPEDQPLRVAVATTKPGVRVRTRGRIVIQSDATRLTSKLLAGFASPELTQGEVALRVGLIPAGWKDGTFTARVQIAVPPNRIAGARWDLGASLVSRGRVRADTSASIRPGGIEIPVVLEKEMEFGPGPYELVAVAYEGATDETASTRLEGSWPDLDADLAAIGPIAAVQPAKGAFVRDGVTKGSGNIVVPENETIRPDEPTALLSLVCRAKDQKGPLHVERTLVGETESPFPPQDLDLGADRCAQVLDIVKPGTLGPGSYRYVVRVTGKSGDLAKAERRIIAPETKPTAGSK